MSDATDALAEALAKNKQLAARRLVAKEDLAAELAQLREQRSLISGDDPALDAQIADTATQLAAAEADYRAALDEITELRRLATTARAPAVALPEADPFIRSAEEIALDNVREHIAGLDAEARVAADLAERETAAAPRKPTREEADAAARAEFEALRAKREKKE